MIPKKASRCAWLPLKEGDVVLEVDIGEALHLLSLLFCLQVEHSGASALKVRLNLSMPDKEG